MFNLKLNDGSPNFNIPLKMKFDTMSWWLKTIGRDKFEDENFYNPALDLTESFCQGLSEDFIFCLTVCIIFLNVKYHTDVSTILEHLGKNDLVDYCYRKFIEDVGLN